MIDIKQNTSLLPYNTFHIDVKANYFVEIHNEDQLTTLINSSEFKNNAHLTLGGGSNMLLTKDFEGIVIYNQLKGFDIINEEEDYTTVKVQGGENWHQFVLWTIQSNWQGLENLSLIPGSVGACPIQNIGAYGVEVKDFITEVDAFNFASGKLETFSNEDCKFGYRNSIFKTDLKNKLFITSVTFKLNKKPNFNINYGIIKDEIGNKEVNAKNISDAVIKIRKSKLPDPEEIGNSGSFFKNPVISKDKFDELLNKFENMPSYKVDENQYKIPAGWIIDTLNWKGKTIDNRYGVHKKQALVLVNYGNATGEEIYNLSTKIIDDVKTNFGIKLEREVNIL